VDASGPTQGHTYSTSGKQTVTLTVTDSGGKQDETTIGVFPGNTARPVPTIESSALAPDGLFSVGEEITLAGTATDADDGSVPFSQLTWEVLQHHSGTHTHPYFDRTGNNLKFDAPAPEDLFATDPAGNYLEIRLTATASQGLSSKTVSQRLEPNTVGVTFATRPIGLKLTANGKVFRAPQTLVSWEGYKLNVNAPAQRDAQGRYRVFRSWSDGGNRSHTITTPPDSRTYSATFVVR
jgi:PKD repeat protein